MVVEARLYLSEREIDIHNTRPLLEDWRLSFVRYHAGEADPPAAVVYFRENGQGIRSVSWYVELSDYRFRKHEDSCSVEEARRLTDIAQRYLEVVAEDPETTPSRIVPSGTGTGRPYKKPIRLRGVTFSAVVEKVKSGRLIARELEGLYQRRDFTQPLRLLGENTVRVTLRPEDHGS
jgi:hypothetical protein